MEARVIIVMGPKHSGKSQCVRALGKIAGLETADLDELIESRTGKSVRALFLEAPHLFRKAEADALEALLEQFKPLCQSKQKQTCLVIAAGGGIVDNTEALALIRTLKEASFVYLHVSAETAWQRIVNAAKASGLPPFLNTENPKETHTTLHERRAGQYKAIAHLAINAENKSPEEIADEIFNFYRKA